MLGPALLHGMDQKASARRRYSQEESNPFFCFLYLLLADSPHIVGRWRSTVCRSSNVCSPNRLNIHIHILCICRDRRGHFPGIFFVRFSNLVLLR
jgi:hypothetical protein